MFLKSQCQIFYVFLTISIDIILSGVKQITSAFVHVGTQYLAALSATRRFISLHRVGGGGGRSDRRIQIIPKQNNGILQLAVSVEACDRMLSESVS